MIIVRMNCVFRSHVGAKIFNFPKLTLILGGAASGKSAFAEALTLRHIGPHQYIATAQAFDAEMRAKIEKHQRDRGNGWHTIEAPNDLVSVLNSAPSEGIILIDCLTLWLTNNFLQKTADETLFSEFLAAANECSQPIVTVSNEVGHGIVPDNRLSRDFRALQGRLNQKVAAQADLAVMITAGLPQVLKGQLP